ncbi:MAG: HAMP domain-containing histidine kinase [Rhodospirillales bacterium]|nr:HAMP domain-containing histidine kinase [Rhodospirillales bacterium]
MTDIVLESVRALVLLAIFIFLWHAGRARFRRLRVGWNYILSGFGLLLLGSLFDITDNFESLNRFVIIGDTEVEAFMEKFVGFLGGFVLIAIGLFKWIPGVQGLSDLVDARTRELSATNRSLETEMAERQKAETVKAEFVSTVSHELRTPLTSIKGSLGLVKSGVAGDLTEKMASMIDIAYKNSDRLVLLINDILDIGKLESGNLDYQMAPVELGDLLRQAVESNEGYGSEFNVTFKLSNEVPEAWVYGDADRLIQVMSNLISNAAKFSPENDRVEVLLSRRGRGFRVSVSDHGPGVPEEFRDRVFGKFSQAESADSRQRGGTGLGLYIARAIVDHHGGAIGFDTEIDNGASFFFDLPAWSGEMPSGRRNLTLRF